MKHGKYYLVAVLRCIALCSFVCLFSCHTIHKTTETKEVRESSYYNDSAFVNSMEFIDTVRTEQRDSSRATATESGTIFVQRDNTGKPEKISFLITKTIQANTRRNTATERWFYGLNSSRHSESSGSVDSVNEKTEETTEEINTAISLENIIGPGLLGLVLLYLIYLFFADIVWPWIKQKRSR